MTEQLTPGPSRPHSVALDLTGRTALVTGAASGIGRACALRLAAAGAKVRAVDRDADGLRALQNADSGGATQPHPIDLTGPEGLEAAERAAAGADILVNNAGAQLVRPIEEFPPADFRRLLTLMLEAPFRLVRGALPHMYGQGWGRARWASSGGEDWARRSGVDRRAATLMFAGRNRMSTMRRSGPLTCCAGRWARH